MHVFFSTSPSGDVFGVAKRKNWGQAELTDSSVFPHWTWNDIQFGDWNEQRRKDVNIEIPMVCAFKTNDERYSFVMIGRQKKYLLALGRHISNKG
jgi:hypothetical protein